MQLQSLEYMDRLKEAGFPDYSPAAIAVRIDEWVQHPVYKRLIEKRGMESMGDSLRETVKRLCSDVDAFAVPSTLVHGDFNYYNWAFRDDVAGDDGIIFFDWQTCCISHPFCDISYSAKLSLQHVDMYLSVWSDFISLGDARNVVKIASKFRLVIKLAWCIAIAIGSPENLHVAVEQKLCGLVREIVLDSD